MWLLVLDQVLGFSSQDCVDLLDHVVGVGVVQDAMVGTRIFEILNLVEELLVDILFDYWSDSTVGEEVNVLLSILNFFNEVLVKLFYQVRMER